MARQAEWINSVPLEYSHTTMFGWSHLSPLTPFCSKSNTAPSKQTDFALFTFNHKDLKRTMFRFSPQMMMILEVILISIYWMRILLKRSCPGLNSCLLQVRKARRYCVTGQHSWRAATLRTQQKTELCLGGHMTCALWIPISPTRAWGTSKIHSGLWCCKCRAQHPSVPVTFRLRVSQVHPANSSLSLVHLCCLIQDSCQWSQMLFPPCVGDIYFPCCLE